MAEFNKEEYWKKRMTDRLEVGYQATLAALKDVGSMAVFLGVKDKDFKDGILEIGEGFNTIKDLIDKAKFIEEKPKKKEDVKSE